MKRYGWVGLMLILAAVAAWGCGDDDDGPQVAPPSGSKALKSLSARELRGLCQELLDRVRDVSTAEQQCVSIGLSTASTASACDTAKKSCIDHKSYEDFSKDRCAVFDAPDAGRTLPTFDCDTTVSEVRACYVKVSSWLEGLRCSQAGKAAEIPSCIDELSDGKCSFGLSQLLADTEPTATDAGALSCEPKKMVSCLCTDGEKGTQTCNADGVYEPCICGTAGTSNECKSGSKSYPYDFGAGDECNQCATKSCCISFVDCQSDADCACYWDCLGQSGQPDCYSACGITDSPPAFVEHAVCLRDSCRSQCQL
jgi:hypothetical protein